MSDTDYIARPDLNMKTVAIEGVEAKAASLAIDAQSLQRYIRTIGDMPVYNPRVVVALRNADLVLTSALLVVRIAQEQIKKHRG